MRKLNFKVDRKSLEIIYIVIIRSLQEYGDVIWDNCAQYEKQQMEKDTTRSSSHSYWNN